MKTMKDETLLYSYQLALELHLDLEFIELLEEEMHNRNLHKAFIPTSYYDRAILA